MRTAFIGHREIFAEDVDKRLFDAIQTEIDCGCTEFTMGNHGQFDSLALGVCKELRNKYKDLQIEVVITSLNALKKNTEYDFVPYSDVKTVMYDIENVHYKRQIIVSNRQMIESCDTLICYVDTSSIYRSGANTALRYAEKKGVKIVNLYRSEDKAF